MAATLTLTNNQISTLWNALVKSGSDPLRSSVYGSDELRLAGQLAKILDNSHENDPSMIGYKGPSYVQVGREQVQKMNPGLAWAYDLDI
jgi:hypothetical protein